MDVRLLAIGRDRWSESKETFLVVVAVSDGSRIVSYKDYGYWTAESVAKAKEEAAKLAAEHGVEVLDLLEESFESRLRFSSTYDESLGLEVDDQKQ